MLLLAVTTSELVIAQTSLFQIAHVYRSVGIGKGGDRWGGDGTVVLAWLLMGTRCFLCVPLLTQDKCIGTTSQVCCIGFKSEALMS